MGRTSLRVAAAVVLGVAAVGEARADEARYVLPPGVPPPPPCDACPPWGWTGCDARRGPVEIRDEYPLAQPRLTLPSISPDTLGCGVTTLRGFLHWSNSFGFDQDVTGEEPADRRFLVDGETRTFEVEATRGVARDVDLALRVPVHWRGGGLLDSLIDAYHELTGPIGIRDNDRPDFDRDRFRVEGRTEDGDAFDWDEDGTGLGNVEVSAKWRFLDGCRDGWSAAAVLRLALPTGTGPFDTGAFGVGAQVAAARRLGRSFDVFVGVGGTAETEDEVDGVGYETFRGHAFAALEWRPASTWSLVLTTDYATGLVDDVANFESEHWYLHLDAKIDLGCRARLEVGFTENLIDQQATADFAIHVGLVVRL